MLIEPVDLRLCYRSERSNSVFIFYNIRDVFRIEGMLKVFIFWGMGAVFESRLPSQNVQLSCSPYIVISMAVK